jgi:flavodoxin
VAHGLGRPPNRKEQIMDALVVYESLWGNTEEVARAVAEGLAETMEVEVVDVASLPALPDELRLLVAGGPTHAFSLTRPTTRADAVSQGATHPTGAVGLREWLERLPGDGAGPVVATFDTRVDKVRRLPGSAARKAARIVRQRGYRRLAPARSFYVADTPGPLLQGEVERAREWGRELAAQPAPAR